MEAQNAIGKSMGMAYIKLWLFREEFDKILQKKTLKTKAYLGQKAHLCDCYRISKLFPIYGNNLEKPIALFSKKW